MPVWVHPDDRRLAAHPYRYRPQQNRFAFPVRHPRSWPILGAMTAAGALAVRGVEADRTYADGEVLPVPGRPRAVHTPGHTWGQSVFHLPDRDVLISGDALVTLDPYTGERGPRLVAPAATSDTGKAYAALDRIAGPRGPAGAAGPRRPLARGHRVRRRRSPPQLGGLTSSYLRPSCYPPDRCRGSRTVITVFPGADSIVMSPRWRSTTIRWAMSSPSPVPRPTSLVV